MHLQYLIDTPELLQFAFQLSDAPRIPCSGSRPLTAMDPRLAAAAHPRSHNYCVDVGFLYGHP
jgi:hypothetical protein